MRLSFENHDRDLAGLTHVYPVISRRARGLSVGINLNPNNACNFRCIYCQVPELVHGKAPVIDLDQLEDELDRFLEWVQTGDFMQKVVPQGSRRLNDLAFSGNGEPTSVADFERTVARVAGVMQRRGLLHKIKLILITNGSLIQHGHVQRGLERLAAASGEVWFKLDAATREEQLRINSFQGGMQRIAQNLRTCAELAPTWIQSCCFATDGQPPGAAEQSSMLDFLRRQLDAGLKLEGLLLYGIARPSHQPEAPTLGRLTPEWLETWADRLRGLGLEVRVSA